MKTLAQLTPAQQKAYRRILEAGELKSGDGVRTATIEVLEREGFVSVTRTSRKTRHVTRTGVVHGGTESTWVAVDVLKDEAPKDDYKPAKKPHTPSIVKLIKNMGYERANMPEHGG